MQVTFLGVGEFSVRPVCAFSSFSDSRKRVGNNRITTISKTVMKCIKVKLSDLWRNTEIDFTIYQSNLAYRNTQRI